MFSSISKLFSAMNTLSENVLALAGSIGEANANFRQRLALDQPDPIPPLGRVPAPAPLDAERTAAE